LREECILGNALSSRIAAGVHCDAVAVGRCAAGGGVLGGVLHALRVVWIEEEALVAREAVTGSGAEAAIPTDLQSHSW